MTQHDMMDGLPFQRVAVIGAGAWGTALAQCARWAGCQVQLWARREAIAAAINQSHENSAYLAGVALDPALWASSELAAVLSGTDMVLLVVPSQQLRGVAQAMRGHLSRDVPLVVCAKGVEVGTGALMSQVVASELPGNPLAVLSGPNFAAEVARGLPTATTLAVQGELGPGLVASLGSATFRPYLSDDLVGVEVAGAVKNVLAIACGIAQGRGLGENARAALITRGLLEVGRLGVALGGRLETMMGLAGMGDLTLTCSSIQSRNMSFGVALGQGQSQQQVLAGRQDVVEGVVNAASVTALAKRHGVEMPICQAVNRILYENAPIDQVIRELLERPFRNEMDEQLPRRAVLDDSNDALRDSLQ